MLKMQCTGPPMQSRRRLRPGFLGARKSQCHPRPHPSGIHGRFAYRRLTVAKVELYRAARAQGVSKAELARRLGWHGPQVDRLFDLSHRSTIEHIDQALRVIGKRLDVSVQDAA
jgi:hypothetical protein